MATMDPTEDTTKARGTSDGSVERERTVRYGIGLRLDRPFAETVEAVRGALAEQGFGVLTEIDVRTTMKTKLGVDVPAQVILGACNPSLAHAALEVEPSLGLLLPCNVVVREDPVGGTIVEAIEPNVLVTFTGNPALEPIAAEVSRRLSSALAALADASATEETR
jgi:uncharacterized protein (DUF302 family)